jgi:hypothetical protein
MDKVIAKPVTFVTLGELAHLGEINLVMASEAIQDMLKVFGIARDIEGDGDDRH